MRAGTQEHPTHEPLISRATLAEVPLAGLFSGSIGAQAKVRVDANKTASAHDLRRAFGERWAARLMPAQLMELMRHESIETTLSYYVGRNAERTAAILWREHEKAADQEPRQRANQPSTDGRF